MMGAGRDRTVGASKDLPVVAVLVDGQTVTIDQRLMTMRERQLVKAELAKLPYPADEMDALVGAIWVAMRRNDPSLTYEQVADSVTFGDLVDADTVEVEEASSPEV